MPVMDGLEAARRIRELDDDRATVPIIALTAEPLDERRGDDCIGVTDFIQKPIIDPDGAPREGHLLARAAPRRTIVRTAARAPSARADSLASPRAFPAIADSRNASTHSPRRFPLHAVAAPRPRNLALPAC